MILLTFSAGVEAVGVRNVLGEGGGEAFRARTVAPGAGRTELTLLDPQHLAIEVGGQGPRNGAQVESLTVVPFAEHDIVAEHVGAREVGVEYIIFRLVLDGSVLDKVVVSEILWFCQMFIVKREKTQQSGGKGRMGSGVGGDMRCNGGTNGCTQSLSLCAIGHPTRDQWRVFSSLQLPYDTRKLYEKLKAILAHTQRIPAS